MALPYKSSAKLRRDNALSEITSNPDLKAKALINLGINAGAGGILNHVQVQLAAADIIGMYAAPVQLVAAPAAGHSIAVAKLIFQITRTSTAFTGGGAVIAQYDSTTHGGGTQALDSTLASTVVTGAAGASTSIRNGAVVSDSAATDNKGLFISNQTGAFAAGTGTAVVDVWYYVN